MNMYAWQFIEMDEFDSRTNDFIEKCISKYKLRETPSSEIKVRSINSAYNDSVVTDDRVIEILSDNKLVALQYLRRDDFNYTEVTNIEL